MSKPPKMPAQYIGATTTGGGYTKTEPRKWTDDEINWCMKLKSQGFTYDEIAESVGRTGVSVSIKIKRLSKSDNTYNSRHIERKYQTNDSFVKLLQPTSVVDVYCGSKKFYSDYVFITKYYTNDKDTTIDSECHLDALKYLCKLYLEGVKADVVDLDPFGSAYDCFDLALKIAQRGIVITFGEMGHKRWKRLDYVQSHYGISSLEDFTIDNLINNVVEIGLRNKKKLTPLFVQNWNNISRVWFTIEGVKITEQWDKEKENDTI